jgi:hypothetical protein
MQQQQQQKKNFGIGKETKLTSMDRLERNRSKYVIDKYTVWKRNPNAALVWIHLQKQKSTPITV